MVIAGAHQRLKWIRYNHINHQSIAMPLTKLIQRDGLFDTMSPSPETYIKEITE